MAGTNVATPSMQAFLDAFNAHDVDAVMSFFTEDCVFDMPRGPAPGGRRLTGRKQVRAGIHATFGTGQSQGQEGPRGGYV